MGLSSRLALVTIAVVLLAEVLVYVPALTMFRRSWLDDRLIGAKMAALVLAAYPVGTPLPEEVEKSLKAGIPGPIVALRGSGTRWLQMRDRMPPTLSRTFDLRQGTWWGCLRGVTISMTRTGDEPSLVIGKGVAGVPAVGHVELIFDEGRLQDAMYTFTRSFLLVSLLVSGITAGIMFMVLHQVLVRPVHRLTNNIAAFSDAPEDSTRVITPSGRTDEIGVAERALARMETSLASELRQKRHLAELGLAVSKINHELRNMLTTAQLLGDRLGETEDPTVKRIAPRLIKTLNRAIAFCGTTLTYGRAGERLPLRNRVSVKAAVLDLADLTRLAPEIDIALDIDVAGDFCVEADPEHLTRILANLLRNAVQALAIGKPAAPRIAVTAWRDHDLAVIRVSDNGPGVPARLRSRIFDAFETSERPDGTGLGLSIADELVQLQGGTLTLEPSSTGASFLISLPDGAERGLR